MGGFIFQSSSRFITTLLIPLLIFHIIYLIRVFSRGLISSYDSLSLMKKAGDFCLMRSWNELERDFWVGVRYSTYLLLDIVEFFALSLVPHLVSGLYIFQQTSQTTNLFFGHAVPANQPFSC